MGIKIAVRAFAHTPRDVDVQRQGRQGCELKHGIIGLRGVGRGILQQFGSPNRAPLKFTSTNRHYEQYGTGTTLTKQNMPTQHLSREAIIKNLRSIPGVGPSIAGDLYDLGITCVEDLRGQNPEALYAALSEQLGQPVDRCMLYVFRCAIYFASHRHHEPQKLKWWNWKDPV